MAKLVCLVTLLLLGAAFLEAGKSGSGSGSSSGSRSGSYSESSTLWSSESLSDYDPADVDGNCKVIYITAYGFIPPLSTIAGPIGVNPEDGPCVIFKNRDARRLSHTIYSDAALTQLPTGGFPVTITYNDDAIVGPFPSVLPVFIPGTDSYSDHFTIVYTSNQAFMDYSRRSHDKRAKGGKNNKNSNYNNNRAESGSESESESGSGSGSRTTSEQSTLSNVGFAQVGVIERYEVEVPTPVVITHQGFYSDSTNVSNIAVIANSGGVLDFINLDSRSDRTLQSINTISSASATLGSFAISVWTSAPISLGYGASLLVADDVVPSTVLYGWVFRTEEPFEDDFTSTDETDSSKSGSGSGSSSGSGSKLMKKRASGSSSSESHSVASVESGSEYFYALSVPDTAGAGIQVCGLIQDVVTPSVVEISRAGFNGPNVEPHQVATMTAGAVECINFQNVDPRYAYTISTSFYWDDEDIPGSPAHLTRTLAPGESSIYCPPCSGLIQLKLHKFNDRTSSYSKRQATETSDMFAVDAEYNIFVLESEGGDGLPLANKVLEQEAEVAAQKKGNNVTKAIVAGVSTAVGALLVVAIAVVIIKKKFTPSNERESLVSKINRTYI